MNADQDPEFNPHARAALLQALEDQLTSKDTPEVKAQLQRLLAEGVKMEEAKEMMALVLMFHITRMMQTEKPFDYKAYLAELRRLPDVDYDQPI